jgi:hypothetical protein
MPIDPDKLARIQQVLDDWTSSLASGKELRPEDLIAARPDLMPELAEELRQQAAVTQGVRGLQLGV